MILAWARLRSSWVWLLILFTFSSFIETIFFGQLGAFTPLYLPRIGVRPEEVTLWTGIIASVSGILGLPFLPFWGALADRYARKPVLYVPLWFTCSPAWPARLLGMYGSSCWGALSPAWRLALSL